MRGAWLVGLLLLTPVAAAVEPYIVLVDWQEGTSLAGTTALASSPLAASYAFDVPTCYPHLLADLLYDPEELLVRADGVGEVGLGYDFLVEVWHEGERVSRTRLGHSGYGTPIGDATEVGAHEVRLSLATGADVSWAFRLRARLATEDPACAEPI